MRVSREKPDIPFPPGLDQRTAADGEIEWERIMVQITFAFVIILGYLISVGMDETRDLAAENEASRRKNIVLESIVSDLSQTELGRERKDRIAAQRKEQLERLLRIWSEVRVDRRLYRLLRQFEYADFIPLSDDERALPLGKSFVNLVHETDRVFITEGVEVATGEVFVLIQEVLTKAGFDVASERDFATLDDLSPDASASHFDERMPTMENLRMLRLQIVEDLLKDRDSLAQVQYSLVGRIMAARLERLGEVPLESETVVEEPEADLATAMLDAILQDLHETMRLLPETARRIRGVPAAGATDAGEEG